MIFRRKAFVDLLALLMYAVDLIQVLFENFPYVLSDEIGNRASLKQKYFDQPELWYLIYTLLSAAHEFHKNGKKVGDVRP